MKRNIYIFIVLSLRAGSSFLQDRQEVSPVRTDLPEEIVAGADTASIDSISWQSLYVDTTLQRLITIALDNNKDMKIAVAKVKEMIASKLDHLCRSVPGNRSLDLWTERTLELRR